MIALYKRTYKLSMAILTNSIVYRLRQLPLIKRLIPGFLYGNEGINAFLLILSLLYACATTIISQGLYLGVLVLIARMADTHFTTLLYALIIIIPLFSSFHYNKAFMGSKQKYYAIVLMRIDANAYVCMDFTKTLVKNAITSSIILYLMHFLLQVPIACALLYPIFYVSFKIITANILLHLYAKKKILYSDKATYNFGSMFLMIASCIVCFLLIQQSISINLTIPLYILAFLCAIIATFTYMRLCKTRTFKSIYKKKLNEMAAFLDVDVNVNVMKKSMGKNMDGNVVIDTNKTGFDFFNTVFFKRHKKILLDSSIKFSMVYAVILGICCVALWLLPQARTQAYSFLQFHLPYILIVMYFTNRGARVTMAMFVNCDASMLHYRFYRQPKIIVSLFTQRLKTVVLVNLLPSIVLSCGSSLCLFISNNQAPLSYYGMLFCAINAVSIFFSVHYLIIYYLLQPYNQKMQATGFAFNVISSLTYIICYMLMKETIHIFPFTLCIVCFCIVYIIISLILAYRLAPKTFKLKN